MAARIHILLFSLIFLAGSSSQLSAGEYIGGRSLSEWAADLQSENPVIRSRAALTLPAFGSAAVPQLEQALNSSDPTVIYWAANGLGDLAEISEEGKEQLRELLKHELVGVRLSTAFALCRNGDVEAGLPVLVEGLQHPLEGVGIAAADLLGRVGPPAKEALPALEKVMERPPYHNQKIALEAIRRIKGE